MCKFGENLQNYTSPLVILYKKRCSNYNFTSPIFKALNLLKFYDIVFTYSSSFMNQCSKAKGDLPDNQYNELFVSANTRSRYQYSTRLASKAFCVLPYARTKYGISFCDPQAWSSINDESFKRSLTVQSFKRKLKTHLIGLY